MICTILLSFSSWFSGIPALDSVRTEVIDGKTYIIHRVEQKETLFSISRRYGVALISVVENNPNAGSGLEIGQFVKVPYNPNNRTKTREGTIHRVGPKETLYSISKQYGVTVDEIKSWNTLTSNGLNLGQELLIKDKIQEKKVVSSKIPDSKEINTHTVTAAETMYAISRKYGVTIQQLKEWNQLTSTDLKPGQVIFISGSAGPNESNKSDDKASGIKVDLKNNEGNSKSDFLKESENKNRSTLNPSNIPVTESVTGSDEVHETGMAALLEGTDGNRKYLAYHRTMKPGAILRVKNNTTRKEVFVRVIGNLPGTEASDVVIRISKSAFDRLSGEGKFPVEITYFK
jgi:LysM repeat protein